MSRPIEQVSMTRASAGLLWLLGAWCAQAADLPQTVHFPSRDGATELVGYLFEPVTPGPHAAIVMLHGRSGPYSSLAKGRHDAATLSMRHRAWGRFWAERGYVALLVDSFGPRGHAAGFPKHSYQGRPPEVSEQAVRPLDAYGALDFLRERGDVIRDRIGVQGWSNGGMTVLATLGPNPPGLKNPTSASGFRAALALYPSCRIQSKQPEYRPYAPMLILVASEDDEVSPRVCETFATALKGEGVDLDLVTYEGAHHSFDDPGKTKQSHEPNRRALADSRLRAERFFALHLR
jgi:dienelactone hydrolase